MAAEPAPSDLTACTVIVTCTDRDVKIHVKAPAAASETAQSVADSHAFARAKKKVGDDNIVLSGSFHGDPTSIPPAIEQQLQHVLDETEGIPPQWRETIQRYGTAQYGKIRMREQFRRVLEQRNAQAHDHVDASAPTGPSSTGSRNTGSKTGHSGMTRRSGER